jgi:hypothetical protein
VPEHASQPQQTTTWEYLKILFDENPRVALLQYLGLDGDKMSAEISAFIQAQNNEALGNEIKHGRLQSPSWSLVSVSV